MNKIDFHEFYDFIWSDDNLTDIISDRFIDEERDYIREYTMQIYRQYELRPEEYVSLSFIKKMVEINFTALALFEPKIWKIKPVSDRGRNQEY